MPRMIATLVTAVKSRFNVPSVTAMPGSVSVIAVPLGATASMS